MTRVNLSLKRRMLGIVTQTEIARMRGCTIEHVNSVLNGRRQSKRLEQFIEDVIAEREGAVAQR